MNDKVKQLGCIAVGACIASMIVNKITRSRKEKFESDIQRQIEETADALCKPNYYVFEEMDTDIDNMKKLCQHGNEFIKQHKGS